MSWREQAACIGQSELMFDFYRTSQAKALCEGCPVREECLTWGLKQPYMRKVHFIFGGLTSDELKQERRRRGQSRRWAAA